MVGVNLAVEFSRNQLRLKDGTLVVYHTDKHIIDQLRKWLGDRVNEIPPVKEHKEFYQLHYSYNLYKFQSVIDDIKEVGGGIRQLNVDIKDFDIEKGNLHIDKKTFELSEICRIYVVPKDLRITFLTRLDNIGYTYYSTCDGDYQSKLAIVREGAREFRPYIDPIINDYMKNLKKTKIAEKKIVSEKVYSIKVDDKNLYITSSKGDNQTREILETIYGTGLNIDNIISIDIDALKEDYNKKIQERIKELQNLKLA